MPNSLKCRLKKLAYQGLLSEKDLSRIYTDNDVAFELEKIKAGISKIDKIYYPDLSFNETGDCYIRRKSVADVIDKHISELKGETE